MSGAGTSAADGPRPLVGILGGGQLGRMLALAGHSLGIAFRPLRAAAQTSPAALRLSLDADGELRVLKARGANPPARSLRWRQRAPMASAPLPTPALMTRTPQPGLQAVLPLH